MRYRCLTQHPRERTVPVELLPILVVQVLLSLTGVRGAIPASSAPLMEDGIIQLRPTIAALRARAAFSFAIVSDHKGHCPQSRKPMKNCVAQVAQLAPAFAVGLGDHLTHRRDPKHWPNTFLDFLRDDPFWRRHFYPNIADGENAYYGQGQGDWGSGRGLTAYLDMYRWPEVALRHNGCEYYARIPVKKHVVHLIQLYFSDNPRDPAVAFTQDSRDYLVKTLQRIDKQPGRDLIVVGAHTGNWPRVLSQSEREILLAKADLVLGATTHHFERYSYGDAAALVINTGSAGFASRCHNGWVSAHVFADPLAVLVQYQNADQPDLRVVAEPFGFVKVVDGRVFPMKFLPAAAGTREP